MMRGELLPEAKADLLDGIAWFEGLKPGLGTAFENEFYSALDRIKTNPEFYAKDYTEYHPVRLKRFTAVLYFRPTQDCIVVVGLFVNGRDERRLNG